MATGIKQQDRQNAIAGWLFMTPALGIFAVFVVIPIIFAVIVSFTDWNGISPPPQANFVGLENYQKVLLQPGITQTDFFTALKNTTYFAMFVVPAQTILAMVMAIVINQQRLRFRHSSGSPTTFPRSPRRSPSACCSCCCTNGTA